MDAAEIGRYVVYSSHYMLYCHACIHLTSVLRSSFFLPSLTMTASRPSLLLEGGLNREQNMRFGLSAEEAGLILELLPENPVHLIRRPPAQNNSGDAVSYDTGEVPDKVMRITPGEGGTCSFLIDYEKDGVGGQSLTGSDGNQTTGPLEVVAQLGEMQVIREVMRSTIPHLVGWSTMLDANVRHNIDNAVRMRQDQGGHQNYPHSNRNAGGYSNSGSGGGGPPVPF